MYIQVKNLLFWYSFHLPKNCKNKLGKMLPIHFRKNLYLKNLRAYMCHIPTKSLIAVIDPLNWVLKKKIKKLKDFLKFQRYISHIFMPYLVVLSLKVYSWLNIGYWLVTFTIPINTRLIIGLQLQLHILYDGAI